MQPLVQRAVRREILEQRALPLDERVEVPRPRRRPAPLAQELDK
jgi:hypothetical protein